MDGVVSVWLTMSSGLLTCFHHSVLQGLDITTSPFFYPVKTHTPHTLYNKYMYIKVLLTQMTSLNLTY